MAAVENQMSQRPERFQSHALVEMRRFKYFPCRRISGVLLDLSLSGFKLELTNTAAIRPGDSIWLTLPLRPLGVLGPPAVSVRCKVKWFDAGRYRIGGVFVGLQRTEGHLIAQVVENLRQAGFIST